MPKAFVATVQLLLKADDWEDACDAISAVLTDSDAPYLLDWNYYRLGPQYCYPTERPDVKLTGYAEGDFLKDAPA